MKRAARQQKQINLSDGQNRYSNQDSFQEENGGKPSQSRVIELFPKRISIERLRVIWNDSDDTYTDEELLMIRDWCYAVAEVTLSIVTSQRAEIQSGAAELTETTTHTKKSIPLPAYDNHTTRSHEATEESHTLHPRIYRRAS